MKRPLIGITAGLFTVETGVFAGMERVYVNRDYVDAIEKAGGVPLLLPPVEDDEAAAYFAGLCAGFLFSGGIDVNPVLYGHEPHAALGRSCLCCVVFWIRTNPYWRFAGDTNC